MAVELATAYVSLTTSAKGIGSSIASELGSELNGPLKKAGDDAGAQSSAGFLSKFAAGLGGLKALAIGAAGVVGAAFAGALVLENIGSDFDEAFDNIRTTTGATGTELAALEGSFKSVFTSVPASMGDASDAIAALNQRLGLTGKPLEALGTQFLNLSRITGTDLGANVEAVSGLFNQFGVSAEAQGGKLDQLFRISQETGVSIADLATQMSDSGTAFREVGLGFEESASLLGLLAKNGLSASDVLPAVSRSLATAAKDGKSAEQVFADTFAAIASAPDDVSAAGLALDVFGARAGPKFAALIRSGQLSYEEFARTIASGGDSINGAAAATDDWREKLTLLKNKALVAIEPVASKLFDGLTKGIEKGIPAVQAGIKSLVDGFKGVGDGGFLSQVGEITAQVVEVVQREWPKIKEIITEALTTAQQVISGFVDVVTTIWAQFGPQIVSFVSATWESVKGTIEGALQIIQGIVKTITALIHGDWSGVWEGIKQIVAGAWDVIVAVVTGALGRLKAALSVLLEILSSIFTAAWNKAKELTGQAVDAIVGFIRDLPGKIRNFAGAVADAGLAIGKSIIDGIGRGLSNAVGIAADIGAAVARAAKGAVNSVIRLINSALEFTIPGPGPLPDIHVNPPDIPTLHGGGRFSAAAGEGLAILADGERVLTPAQSQGILSALTNTHPAAATILFDNRGALFADSKVRFAKVFGEVAAAGQRAGGLRFST